MIPPAFEDAEGPLAADLAAVDWAATSLGPPSAWPTSLVAAVRTVLRSRFSMWMGWGPDLVFFCNDAYRRDTLGAKYPWALGRPARQVWAEIWSDIGPRADVVAAGRATWDEALQLFLERSGYREETYHTFSYSPLVDDAGAVTGLLCVVTEDTERVVAGRRMATLRDLGAGTSPARTTAEALAAAARHLAGNPQDLPFAAVYTYEGDDAVLGATAGIEPGHPLVPARVGPGAPTPWPFPRPGAPARTVELGPGAPRGAWEEPPRQALVIPLPDQGGPAPGGFLLAGLNRYRLLDDGYQGFLDLVAGQVGAALAAAAAYEAERDRAEQLAELDQAKTAFFTNVSHELRTPLTLLLGPAEDALADAAHPLEPAQRQRVELVARNGLRLLKLVNTLLDFSRLEQGALVPQRRPLDLAVLTGEVASGFSAAFERAGLAFDVRAEPLPGPVWVDEDMWSKVVANLLSNALKFTPTGRVEVVVRPDGADAVLEVSDTGIGIDPAERERVFERFYRAGRRQARTFEGTGIGLALVAELVELHGGAVAVEPGPGGGTTFVVRLPVGPAEPDGAAPAALDPARLVAGYVAEAGGWEAADAAPVPDGADDRPTVLVIDDNADMRGYVARLLAGRYRVRVAADGAEGLELARAQVPDLVLSDIMLPGLDGFAVLAALRADPRTADVPVVLLSARAGEEASAEGLEAGADDYLAKPFSARDLLARVRANLELDRVRRTRDRLARTQEVLDEAQRLAQVGSWELDLVTGAVVGSSELLRQLDLDAEELAERGLEAALERLADDADARRVRAAFADAVATGGALDVEVEVTSPTGVRRRFRTRGVLERGADGRPARLRGSNQDLTEALEAERAVAEAAAAREASAREHRIADELQRSLLPRPTFRPEGLAVASYYRAGVEGTQVGGDWFDVIELGAGRAALVVGDVMGRGVQAAAVMGQLRAAVRAYARLDLPPRDVLDLLDATVCELGDDQIVTCVYAVYDPADRSLTWANAGHLPPLLAEPGRPARALAGTPGPPLGTGRREASPSSEVVLPAGAMLALYTDGLVERRDSDVGTGIGQLGALLTTEVPLAELPAQVVDAMLPHGPSDDVAILVAHVEAGGSVLATTVDVDDDIGGVQRARRFAATVLAGWQVPAEVREVAVLAASELVTNAVVHGKPPVRLRLRASGPSVTIEVADAAPLLPRPVRAGPDDEHGRGLQIVAALADAWGTRATPGGKVVWCRLGRLGP